MVAAAIRTIFAQPKADMVRDQLEVIADFPVPHWERICSTNPLERLNKEIKTPHRRRRRLP